MVSTRHSTSTCVNSIGASWIFVRLMALVVPWGCQGQPGVLAQDPRFVIVDVRVRIRVRCSEDLDFSEAGEAGLHLVIELRDGRQQNILDDGASIDPCHEDAPLDEVDAVLVHLWDGANARVAVALEVYLVVARPRQWRTPAPLPGCPNTTPPSSSRTASGPWPSSRCCPMPR